MNEVFILMIWDSGTWLPYPAFQTESLARDALFGFVKEHWHRELSDAMPQDRDGAINAYFARFRPIGSNYDIRPVPLICEATPRRRAVPIIDRHGDSSGLAVLELGDEMVAKLVALTGVASAFDLQVAGFKFFTTAVDGVSIRPACITIDADDDPDGIYTEDGEIKRDLRDNGFDIPPFAKIAYEMDSAILYIDVQVFTVGVSFVINYNNGSYDEMPDSLTLSEIKGETEESDE